ncbi:MAG: hypothetical protein MSA29_08005 [Lachnospiraceae bacterium]|nr:hypothetical protein [Lachnospiraceae bacterium]
MGNSGVNQKVSGNGILKENKKNWIEIPVFAALVAIASAVTFWLFYRQCVESMLGTGLYHSDMKAYILEMQGLDSGYSFPYPVLFKLAATIHLVTASFTGGAELAMALATMLLNSGAMIALKVMLDKHVGAKLQEAMPGKPWLPGILTGTVAVSLFFVSMVYPPTGIYLPGIKYKYLGVFTPNPFHNATYMAARPFAILAFFKYGELLPVYEQPNAVREHKRDYILFALYLLLATMTKPSFTIVLVGAAGILMLWRMFRSRFRNFVPTVWLGVCFIPTFMDLLYQFRGVFVPQEGQEGGIGFTFGHVWAQYCGNLPLAIGLAIGFPILVLLLNYKELHKDSTYRFSWQVYVMSFLMAFFLYEKGFREMDFNFSWGYMYGIFFAFVGALLVLLRATANADTRKRRIVVAVQWMAYLWHLVCGVYYFGGFLQGAMYY